LRGATSIRARQPAEEPSRLVRALTTTRRRGLGAGLATKKENNMAKKSKKSAKPTQSNKPEAAAAD